MKSQSVHKTKEALEVKPELSCFSCDILTDPELCTNISNVSETEKPNLTRRCNDTEPFCSVKRYSYTMTDKNSTSEKRLWSLTRSCSRTCENGCIIIGERVKLHACSMCCNSSLCNIGNVSS